MSEDETGEWRILLVKIDVVDADDTPRVVELSGKVFWAPGDRLIGLNIADVRQKAKGNMAENSHTPDPRISSVEPIEVNAGSEDDQLQQSSECNDPSPRLAIAAEFVPDENGGHIRYNGKDWRPA